MASIRPRTNKQGDIISYEIRVTRGRNADGKQLKPYVMSWPRPDGWSDKAVQREVAKVAGQFEADCNAGLVLTKEERLKQEREAQREQERLQQEEERKVTFQRYMEVFMQDKGATYSPNTRENYTVVLNRACSTLGDMRMIDIDFLTVKRYVSDLQTEGKNQFNGKPLAYKTVLKHYIVLHAFFANAVENKVIPSNPMQDMKRPKPRKDEIQKPAVSYTAEEVKRLISCLEAEPLKWRALTLFMLDSGCRRGEAVGLKWDSIDFKTGKVEISRNAQYTSGKGTYITTPKSGKSRTIYINAPVLAVMHEWRREQALQFMAQGIPLNGFCFTQDNGKMMNPQAPTAYLERFGKKYGFRGIHPHALRHTMASLSIANGADIVSISKKLGHAEVSITLDVYSHENEEAKQRASSILNEIIYRKQA